MKKIFLMIAMVAGLSAATYAQGDKKPADKRAAHMTKVLKRKLNLSADQASQVNIILLAQATKMDSLKNTSANAHRKSMHLAKRSIMQDTDQKLSSILNPDQLKGYEGFKALRKQKQHEKKDGAVNNTPVSKG